MKGIFPRMLPPFLIAGALVLAGFVRVQVAGAAPVAAWELCLKAKLQKEISCHFDETPLREALAFFRSSLEVNIICDPAIAEKQETLITLQAADIRADRALRAVLRQASLDCVFADGGLYVSTPVRAARAEGTSFQQYEVRDLAVTLAAAGFTGSTTGSTTGNTTGATQGTSGVQATQDLLQLILLFTGPQNWDYVQVLGISGAQGDQSQSREDYF